MSAPRLRLLVSALCLSVSPVAADVILVVDSVTVTRPETGTQSFELDVFVEFASPDNLGSYSVPLDLVDDGAGIALTGATNSIFEFLDVTLPGPAGIDIVVYDEAYPDDLPMPSGQTRLFSATFGVSSTTPVGAYDVNIVDSASYLELAKENSSVVFTIDELIGGSVTVTPEPAAFALLVLGCVVMIARRRRRI